MNDETKENKEISAEVTSTWNICDDKSLNSSIHLLDAEETSNIVNLINAETCVLLQKPNESDEKPLYVSFKLPEKVSVTGLSVLSEARYVEVYDQKNEYVDTIKSLLFEDDDDLKVYQSNIDFGSHVMTEFKLKFVSISKNEMWFYGAAITVSKIKQPVLRPLLNDTSKPQDNALFESAKNFAKLLQGSTANSSLNTFYPSLCQSLMQQQQQSSNSLEQTNSFVFSPNIVTSEASTENAIQSDDLQRPRHSFPTSDNSLKHDIIQSHQDSLQTLPVIISELEDRLWKKLKSQLEAQEQRQTEILNRILALLEENKLK